MKRKAWVLAVGATLTFATACGIVAASAAGKSPAPSAQEPAANTATVERGSLSDTVSEYGTLTFRARSDGSPYGVINQARGTYTELPNAGDDVACGAVLYRVDQAPVLLLCGTVPSYRTLRPGDVGADVLELNRNLHTLGYDAAAPIAPGEQTFTAATARALETLQRRNGLGVTGSLELGDAVFLPEPLRISRVSAELGGPAQPGAPVLEATSDVPEVQLALDPSQQRDVAVGDSVEITLPGDTLAAGTVDRVGDVVEVPAAQNATSQSVTIPVYISLDNPEAARGFDAAPVQVDITTRGVADVLSVPTLALVGRSGGGFAVEVIRGDGRRELVGVTLGLFDTAAGRVQVQGALAAGDRVVVPSP